MRERFATILSAITDGFINDNSAHQSEAKFYGSIIGGRGTPGPWGTKRGTGLGQMGWQLGIGCQFGAPDI